MRSCPRCGLGATEAARTCTGCGADLRSDALTGGPGPTARESALLPGATLGGYRVETEVARGGMGIVYRAFDEALGRPVALKVISPAFAADRVFRERFRRESRLAALVEHPSVVPVYRAGQDGGQLFIAMRYVDGTDLASVLRDEGALAPARAVAWLEQVAGALDAAHAHGLVHRDVKPGNVLLSDDMTRAFLTDFGLTVDLAAGGTLTRTGNWVGTLAYAAPEQLRAGDLDARSDVYALGGVLHHCVTGRLPYPVERELDAMSAHLFAPPPRPSAVDARLPRALDAVVARAMAKDPRERFPSAGDLAAAATAAIDGRPAPVRERSVATGAAAPQPIGEEPAAPTRPRVTGRTLATVAVILGLIGIGVALLADREGPRERGAAPSGGVLNVDGRPDAAVVADDGAVWTMTIEGGALQRADPRTGRSQAYPAPADLGGGDFPAIASGEGALWQTQSAASSGGLTKVDPRGGAALGRRRVPGAVAVTAHAGGVWVSAVRDNRGRLVRIDPASMQVVAGPVNAGGAPDAVLRAGDSVWVADRRRDAVLRYEPHRLSLRMRIAVGDGPAALAVTGGRLWVANLADRTLLPIDLARGEVVGAPVSVGKEIEAIAGSPRTLWVASTDATVTRLDPQTGAVLGAPIAVDPPPLTLAADGDAAWVASATDQSLRRLDAR